MTHIGTILDNALDNFRACSDTEMTRIWEIWKDAVGDTIAQNAQPGAFKKNTLIVHVSSSVWMHHFKFLKQDMLNNINQALNHELVKDIRFKIANLHS
ncbi:MAG: DUF721 domain-containing protein [Thermodesulfobacteriota bacterium]|nr:DUF721 domain-containing protein [Thermodesulfobacteriota bacterium]